MKEHESSANYRRIERAIEFLEANFQDQPSLDAIAASAGLSKYHFQRLFKSFAGITPIQFLHYLTVEYAKSRLANAHSVFDSALDSGLSGGGRLHDMFVNIMAMTPGEFKGLGERVEIQYGIHGTPFGDAFLAITKRGICSLRFLSNKDTPEKLVRSEKSEWPKAVFQEDLTTTRKVIQEIFDRRSGQKKLTLLVGKKGKKYQSTSRPKRSRVKTDR